MALIDHLTQQQKRTIGFGLAVLALGAIGGGIYWSGRPWTCAQARVMLQETLQESQNLVFLDVESDALIEKSLKLKTELDQAFEREATLCQSL